MIIQKLVLGTVQLGLNYGINNAIGKPNLTNSLDILNHAYQNGIQNLDTAIEYGEAQKTIGEFHKKYNKNFNINSKFKSSELTIFEQVNRILVELSVNKLDTLFFHDYNDYALSPQHLIELNMLKRTGIINKIGVSVYEQHEMKQVMYDPYIDVIQLPFNLLDNWNERGEFIKIAKENNKTIQIRSIYLQGLFFRKLDNLPSILKPLTKYLEQIHHIANSLKLTIEELAFGYVAAQKEIDQIIIGVETKEQLQNNLLLMNKNYPIELVEEINKIIILPEYKELLYPKNWNK